MSQDGMEDAKRWTMMPADYCSLPSPASVWERCHAVFIVPKDCWRASLGYDTMGTISERSTQQEIAASLELELAVLVLPAAVCKRPAQSQTEQSRWCYKIGSCSCYPNAHGLAGPSIKRGSSLSFMCKLRLVRLSCIIPGTGMVVQTNRSP